MKIQDDKNIQQAIKPEPQNNIHKKNDDFKKFLSEAQSKIEGSIGEKRLSPDEIQGLNFRLQNASTIPELEESSFSDHLGKSHGAEIKKVEQFLDLFESYTLALFDPEKTLKEIEPLVKSLEREKEKLLALVETLPEGSVLRHIIDQTAILGTLEVLKFNRGDYL